MAATSFSSPTALIWWVVSIPTTRWTFLLMIPRCHRPQAACRPLPTVICLPMSSRRPTLTPLLSRMWKQSRTFRRQCARIGAEPGLLVRVYTAALISQSGDRAATHIHRLRGAAGLEAEVYLSSRAGSSDFIELIAHEFEHIIEQLDGPGSLSIGSPGARYGMDDGQGDVRDPTSHSDGPSGGGGSRRPRVLDAAHGDLVASGIRSGRIDAVLAGTATPRAGPCSLAAIPQRSPQRVRQHGVNH